MRHLLAYRRAALLLTLAGASATSAWAQAPIPAAIATPETVKGILPRTVEGHMNFLASDLMRGRDTASPEIRLAAEYLATRLIAAGADTSPSFRAIRFSVSRFRSSLPNSRSQRLVRVTPSSQDSMTNMSSGQF